MSIPRLKLAHVAKCFGPLHILHDLSFEIQPGQVFVLLGDNGAGKSTLIKIISGFHRPSGGELYFEGQKIHSEHFNPKIARQMGIQTVYQHLGLVENLSITRNFFLGSEPTIGFGPLRVLNQGHMREVVKNELQAMGIKRKIDPNDGIEKLSGGERQAIAISRAKYFGAKLLILDEPTSALSLRQTQEVLDYIALAASLGISVIFITHTLHHLESLADTIAILHRGQCVGLFQKGEISEQECAQLILHGKSITTSASS